MYMNGALSGQTALLPLPSSPPASSVVTSTLSYSRGKKDLKAFDIPVQLQLKHDTNIHNKGGRGGGGGTSSGVLGNGMDVIKVAECGKRQSRRVAISNNKRVLLISSEKVSVKGFLFRKKRSRVKSAGNSNSNSNSSIHGSASTSDNRVNDDGLRGGGNDSFKRIEISSIDRIVRGRVSKKFHNKCVFILSLFVTTV
jgi:hypothetical protein